MNRTLLKTKHGCEFSAAKKIYYLLLMAICVYSLPAEARCVNVKQVSADYKKQTVTFILTWTSCNGTTNLNKVWCLIDFQTVAAAGNKGTWKRATISGAATVTNGTSSAGNATGFYVTGVNAQSATVTVKLSNASGRFNWCAFASDCPPNAPMANGTYTLNGTPPFVINGSTTLGTTQKTYTGSCIMAITDATNNPDGIIVPQTITINGPSSVAVSSSVTLTATPAGNSRTWTSSNTGVATVNNTGIVTGVAVGNTTITCVVTEGGCATSTNFALSSVGGGDCITGAWSIKTCAACLAMTSSKPYAALYDTGTRVECYRTTNRLNPGYNTATYYDYWKLNVKGGAACNIYATTGWDLNAAYYTLCN